MWNGIDNLKYNNKFPFLLDKIILLMMKIELGILGVLMQDVE